jgi:hypothetical protein
MDAGCARTHLMREAACKALTAWTEQGGLERHPRTPAGAANALRLAVWLSSRRAGCGRIHALPGTAKSLKSCEDGPLPKGARRRDIGPHNGQRRKGELPSTTPARLLKSETCYRAWA